MTQELIANMLGVRREGVTEAAGKLQKLGVISYARSQIVVLDRPKLEELCCECYAVMTGWPQGRWAILVRSGPSVHAEPQSRSAATTGPSAWPFPVSRYS